MSAPENKYSVGLECILTFTMVYFSDTNNSQSDGILDRTDGHSTSFDIDNMLDSLENELEGKPLNQPDLVNIPELSELVRVHYPNKLLQIGKFQDKKWLIYKGLSILLE